MSVNIPQPFHTNYGIKPLATDLLSVPGERTEETLPIEHAPCCLKHTGLHIDSHNGPYPF